MDLLLPLNFAIVNLLASELAQAKYITPVFNSKRKYEKLAAVVLILQNTRNLVISRCYFPEDGREMNKDL